MRNVDVALVLDLDYFSSIFYGFYNCLTVMLCMKRNVAVTTVCRES